MNKEIIHHPVETNFKYEEHFSSICDICGKPICTTSLDKLFNEMAKHITNSNSKDNSHEIHEKWASKVLNPPKIEHDYELDDGYEDSSMDMRDN